MAETLEETKVSTAAQTTPSEETRAAEETSGVQSEAADNATADLDSKELPPELEATRKDLLRDYHAKLQQSKEERLRFERDFSKAQESEKTLQKLLMQEWFKQAYEQERARREGTSEFDITDDEFQIMRSDDPRAKDLFKKAVLRAAETIVASKVGPHLNSTKQTVDELKTAKEFDTVAGNPKYKDFRELNDKGALDAYLQKGLSYEDAYKSYKYDHEIPTLQSDFDKKVQDKAQELLEASRNGAISRGGITNVKGMPVAEADTFEEAYDKVFDLISAGHKNVKLQRPSRKG